MGGLASVVLLVSLTNIVIENVRSENATAPATAATATGTSVELTNLVEPPKLSEPLADLGVTPVPEDGAQAGGVPAVVPDLDPDPALQEPMDRDPQRTTGGTSQ